MIAATFATVMSWVGYIAIAILALMFMVVIHELGHYLAGKLLKFKIVEFSIGFGPTFKFLKHRSKKTGELFAIRPIPLGGYCNFEDEDSASDSATAFNNQAPWKRIIVLFSGAFFNFVSALIIITLFFTFYGQILPSVRVIYPDSANSSVLQVGDTILRVNGKQMNVLMTEDVSALLSKTGDSAELVILRDGKRMKVTVTKSDYTLGEYNEDGTFEITRDEDGNPETFHGFGIGTVISPIRLNFFQALGRSFSFMFFLVYKIFAILGQLVTGKLALNNVGGPITTIQVISEAASGGFAMLSYVVCLISANLAVMNLLPLPALDGSRIVFCFIEWIFKKPVNKKVEGAIHAVGLFLLFGFAIFADIFRYVTTLIK